MLRGGQRTQTHTGGCAEMWNLLGNRFRGNTPWKQSCPRTKRDDRTSWQSSNLFLFLTANGWNTKHTQAACSDLWTWEPKTVPSVNTGTFYKIWFPTLKEPFSVYCMNIVWVDNWCRCNYTRSMSVSCRCVRMSRVTSTVLFLYLGLCRAPSWTRWFVVFASFLVYIMRWHVITKVEQQMLNCKEQSNKSEMML